jgi:hypothetical protein
MLRGEVVGTGGIWEMASKVGTCTGSATGGIEGRGRGRGEELMERSGTECERGGVISRNLFDSRFGIWWMNG